MVGNAEKLIKYMNGASKRFIIPVYQRNYDWKMENCKQLYDDLVKLVGHERKSHFFGSMVSVQSESGAMSEYLIIDGQQRLTTVSLLMLAMYHLLSSGEVTSSDPRLAEKILKSYLIDEFEPKETRIKLKHVKNDSRAFGALFDEDEDSVLESNLTINYQYFHDRIRRGELTIDELFDAICRLEIINISLNHEDNPQLIFESLNSTGLDLSEGDKIRNYILMGLSNSKQNEYYEKYWNKIEQHTDYDVSSFIRDYLSVKQQSTPNINGVYVAFKKYVEEMGADDIEVLLKDLLEYAGRYKILLTGGVPGTKLYWCIYRLNRLSTSVTRPFFLEVLRLKDCGALNDNEVVEIFSTVENYIFRRTICDLPTNSLNKIFLLLHREIVRFDGSEENYVEKFKYAILSKRERARYPTDEEFAESASTRNIYGMNPKNKQYLFERLENAGTFETKDVWGHLDRGEYTIEHIMPQHLSREWVTALGDSYEEIHSVWLHRLANLTLTAYNEKYSNRSFADKRDMPNGFKEAGLRMNQRIGQKDKWGLEELEERDTELRNRVVGIWKYPSSTFKPQEKQMDSVSLDEDIDLTGRAISKYIYKGAEQPVSSWAEMYQQVISMLHATNKAILTRFAVSQDPEMDLANHFATSAEVYTTGCRQIDTNVFVWTGTNTQYKINVLRKLFALFGVEESELVFYLKDDENSEQEGGIRYEIRKKYWEYALPQIKAAFGNVGPFSNVNPSTSNWVAGFIGFAGIQIDCVANYDGARVELYIGTSSKEQNKKLFDYLYARKDEIEETAGKKLIWSRMDDGKASKIHVSMDEVDVSVEESWGRMARFHAENSKMLASAFKEHIERYFG